MNRDRRGDAGKPGGGSAIAADPMGVPGKATLTSMLPPMPSSMPKTTSDASPVVNTDTLPVQRKATTDGVFGPLPQAEDRPTPPPSTAIEAEGTASPSPSSRPAATSPTAGAKRVPFLQLSSTPPPVQRKATDDAPAAAPADVAARGVASGGSSLPHLAQIRTSFGRHDVSGVSAHQGPATSEAAHALGARAFAFGNAVGFDGAPDLHTAAHEAAHVVQQRGGVQLKGGIDGGAADPFEQHADAVADAVVRGESAEGLLDKAHNASGAAVGASVQRKPDAAAASTANDDGPPTMTAPHAKWPVFADTGLPYKIVSAKDPVHFWTVSDWLRNGKDFQARGTHAVSPACAAEILEALGWVPKARIASAAKKLVFDITRRVAQYQVEASAFYEMGMPTSRPVVSRVESSKGAAFLEVATRLDDPDVPAGTQVEPDDAQRLEVIRALASYTGLTPASGALDSLRSDPRFHDAKVQSGVILWKIDPETGNYIFGFDDDSDAEGPYTRWLHGKNGKNGKQAPRSDAHNKPKFKLNNYYGVPIPGALRANRTLVEAGQPVWLDIAVQWPSNVPSAEDYEIVPMATVGRDGHSGDVACLSCTWHIEQVGGAVAAPSAPAGSASTAATAPATAAGPAAAAGGTPATPSPDGRAGPGSGAAPATAPSAGSSGASWSAAPVSTVSSGSTATTDVAELHHVFVLPPGQNSGTFRVTVQASQDAYFEPATFTMLVDVKSTAAAMQGLRDAAFGELGAHHVAPTPESFAATGSGDDTEGWRTAGQLPPSFTPSGLDTPDPRAPARAAERKRLEATKMYLQAHGASPDVLAAVDRELAASSATEAALASDRSKGWQPFQVRGTYLSREDDVPSGPLTLYGTVHAEAPHSVASGGAGAESTTDMPGQVVVQIRDLSRRFDNEDLTFTGKGPTFESALKAAFVDNAKAYPAGVMAIEAEAIEASVPGDDAVIGKGTGKTIGFQLGTDSRWKRVKDKVWSPVVNVVVNLGAMALMAFVPGSAVIVAPLLIAYNTTPIVDRMRSKSDSGTLTVGEAATSVGEIALNMLPMAGRAKAFTAGWFVIEGANWGGQAVLLTASALQTARALQAQDVEALAALYEELQQLETAGTNPAAIEAKREQVIARAKAVSQRIEQQIEEQVGTNALFAVTGSVIHRAGTLSEAGRGQMLDALLRKRSGAVPGGDHQTSATNEQGPRVTERDIERVEPPPHHETGRDATDQAHSGTTSESGAGHGAADKEHGASDQPKPPHGHDASDGNSTHGSDHETSTSHKPPATADSHGDNTSTGRTDGPDGHDRVDQAIQEHGHSGVDLHSHFMGNVPSESFAAQLEATGVRAGPGESRWEPLLHEIAKLGGKLGHKFEQLPNGTKVEPEIDPKTRRPVVKTRGPSGDAMALVEKTIDEIDRLHAERNRPETAPARRVEIDRLIDEKAGSAVDKSLRASDETDFNSSYEIRDELVKDVYGKAERDQMLSAKGLSSSDSILKTAAAYREHFKDRPDVLKKIDRAVELQRQLDASEITDPDPRVAERKQRDARAEIALVSEQVSYDAYAKDTLLRLAQDDIRYTEQSNSAKKLGQRFDPEQISQLKAQLKKEHPELAAQIDALEVKYLTMISTNNFGAPDGRVDGADVRRGRTSQAEFEKALRQLVEQTARPDVVGIDVAGIEHYSFDPVAKSRFKQTYEALRAAAKARGEPIVFRPHVGEGAADVVSGKHGARDMDRQVNRGELTHYRRARENLDALISTLEDIADQHKAEFHGKLPPEVIVRFGHATHTTPEQAARISRLGIIVEVNLQSNAETGAVNQATHNHQGGDRARTQDDALPPHQVDPRSRSSNLDDHALGTLVFNETKVVLSTDGHEVMSTNLANEYSLASEIIDDIIQDRRTVSITGQQASAMRSQGGTVPDPGHSKVVEVRFSEMSAEKQQLFRDAYRKFYEDSLGYLDKRPKPDDAGAPAPGYSKEAP